MLCLACLSIYKVYIFHNLFSLIIENGLLGEFYLLIPIESKAENYFKDFTRKIIGTFTLYIKYESTPVHDQPKSV